MFFSNFAHPIFLWLLLLVPIYIFSQLLAKKYQTGFGVSVFSDLQSAQRFTWGYFLPIVRHILIIFLLVLFSIALARPQVTHSIQDVSKSGIDIVVALDVSDSMRAEDLTPNRIEAAKDALQKFISTRTSDRLGIVIFSGVPFTQSPLTFDYNILNYFVKRISTESINQGAFGIGGTAIGDAILAGINRLSDKNDRQKILILISDGDANMGIDPIVAATKAQAEGVKIYTIGIGKKGGAPIPVTDNFGRKTYARNRNGSVYKATFDEKSLQKIASLTGGTFFRADDNAGFQKALTEIDNLQKQTYTINTQTTNTDAFANWLYFLGVVGLFFILLELGWLIQK